jgi:class 3 adenylate cyclase/tetratricopeptide (TPR) repeat protein
MQFNSYERASSANHKLAAERRVVTILFADVNGSTAMAESLDPEDWAEIMNEAFEYMTRPIIHYGGTVARLMGDAVLAFFGAPTAHEDDPLRAVLSGLDIIEGIQPFRKRLKTEFDLDFNIRVGINTGVAVVGEVGSAQAGEYTAMGDEVNLASRMEQTALPGTIQITAETYRMVAPWIEAQSMGGVEIKGKRDLVPVYRVLGRKDVPTQARGIAGISSPLVGRAAELKIIDNMVANLFRQQGQILTLIGEAGLGKSRLIDEMHKELLKSHPGSFEWIEARAISYEVSRPYGLYVQTLRQVCQIEDDEPVEVLRGKVVQTFSSLSDDKQTSIANTIEVLLSASQGIEESTSPTKAEAVKREIFSSMLDIWKLKASEQPLVLVLDDLHWADQASVELTSHLFQLVEQVPIMFVCAFRPHRDSPSWLLRQDAALNANNSHELNLSPLASMESNQLVDNILQIPDLPGDLRNAILKKTEGNPFFIEEVLRTLIDKGVIQRGEDKFQWQMAENYEEFDIPDNLQALLLARIDRLDPDPRRTMQIAAVIGRFFSYRVLAEIAEDVPDLEKHLEYLQLMGLIQLNAQSPEQEFIFLHELTREAAYQSILKRQRRMYHRQVGEAIEKVSAGNLADEAYRLAYHFDEARDYQKALRYYRIAGSQSLKLFANQEANQYLRAAIDLALKLNVTSIILSQLYLSRGRALEFLNDFDAALDNYEELEELGRTRPDRSLELAGLVPQTIIYSMPNVKFNPQIGAQLARRAMHLAIDMRDYEAEARSLWSLMLIQTFTESDLEPAIRYGEQGLTIAREHDLREVEAYLQHDLARPYMRSGRQGDAWDAYQSSQAYWREVKNYPMLADNLGSLAESYYKAGEFDKSLTHAAEGYRISEEIGNEWGMAYNNFVFGPILLERGEIDESLQALEETRRLARQSNFAGGVVATQMIQSWLYAMLGDLTNAQKYQPLVKEFVDQYESFKALYSVNQAQNEFYAGQYQPALQTLQQLGSAYATNSELFFHPFIYTLHVELYLVNDQFEDALKTADGYLDLLDQHQVGIMKPDLINQKARALVSVGDTRQAYEILQQAREVALKQNSRRILWAVLMDLANLEQDAELASEMRREALQIITFISEHISDPQLREKFLHLPRVKAISSQV